MKVYQYDTLEALNVALAEFEQKRIKIFGWMPHYYQVAPSITARNSFSGVHCFYVTTLENVPLQPKETPKPPSTN